MFAYPYFLRMSSGIAEFFGQPRSSVTARFHCAFAARHAAEHLGFADNSIQRDEVARIAPALVADLEQLAGLASSSAPSSVRPRW